MKALTLSAVVSSLSCLAISACATATTSTTAEPAVAATASTQKDIAMATAQPVAPNPLLAPWTGAYAGFPPFAQIQITHFSPALVASMAENRKEIAAIAGNPQPATFENTIAALEDAGRSYARVGSVFGIWSGNMDTSDFKSIEKEWAPKLAAFDDEITQNEKLFQRIEAVYNSPDKAKLTAEQQRLVWVYFTNFVRSGAKLDTAAKKRVGEINQRLATLFTDFGQNVLADEENDMVVLENEADLAGLPDSVKSGMATEADSRKLKGKWVVSNTRSSMEPFLSYSTRRDLREKVWKNYIMRGDKADAHDNNKIISEILKLRVERAKLLGFSTHAHWRLENTMAKTPERALQLMESVWKPAVARVKEEVRDMQAIANKEKVKISIEPWDYRYYAEKVRKAKYDLDENEVKPYLQLEKLREGMFYVAGELFNFSFTQVSGVPVYHPDVRVWEVKDKTSGRHIGLWYFDPYARAGKHSGAWMNAYRNQERFRGEVATIVSNNANFVKGKEGEPILISWSDARTLFHEFGHALHGLSSQVNYPALSGTSVARDYVEFPSQLLEHWVSTEPVLNTYAVHFQTGKPMPKALFAKIEKAAKFNEGFRTVEYLGSALVDMKLHLAGDKEIDSRAFEKETLSQLGMPKEIVMRHRTAQFGHVFSGDGYSAGYYSYLWSDTLTADAAEAFTEGKGFYDKTVAEKLRANVFSVGNTIDPVEGYRAFRGRDVTQDALMRKRGFPFVKTTAVAPAGKSTK